MNRIEFIGHTHQGIHVSIDDIVKYFDHTMAAYELVGNIDNSNVYGKPDNIHSSLEIHVESPDLDKLQEVVDHINGTLHNRKDVYGKTFKVSAQKINDNIVELYVHEELM